MRSQSVPVAGTRSSRQAKPWIVSPGEAIKLGTQRLLCRLSGAASPVEKIEIDHPANGKAQQSTEETQETQEFGERLSQLRANMEKQAESLNDSKFEVTQDWVMKFACQHAEYMEAATSCAAKKHEFRSTTDLLQHVLQHPKTSQLFGGAAASCDDASGQQIGASTAVPTRDAPPHNEFREEAKNGETTIICNMDAIAEVKSVEGVEDITQKSERSPMVSPASTPQKSDTQAFLAVSPHKGLQMRRRSTEGRHVAKSAVANAESELLQKMRRRASTGGLRGQSPLSQRRTDAAAVEKSIDGAEVSLATRRMMLESKLAACGFQTAAAYGGA